MMTEKERKETEKFDVQPRKRGDFVICQNCKKTIPDNANFCKYCGEKTVLVCPDCGTELKHGAMFCSGCGRRVQPETSEAFSEDAPQQFGAIRQEPEQFTMPETATGSGSSRKPLKILVAVLVLLAGAAVGFFGAKTVAELRAENGQENTSSVLLSDADSENAEEESDDRQDAETAGEAEDVNPAWNADGWDPNDYSMVLHPEEFTQFYTAVDRFVISYPASFYQYRSMDFDKDGIGTLDLWSENSDSMLSVSCYERQYQSADQEYDACYRSAEEWIGAEAEEILSTKDPSDGGEARFILNGYGEGAYGGVGRYTLVYITDAYVMKFELQFPEETDHVDKSYKWYYTECIYRMCGFSNSSRTYRTYEEFAADDSWEG